MLIQLTQLISNNFGLTINLCLASLRLTTSRFMNNDVLLGLVGHAAQAVFVDKKSFVDWIVELATLA